MKWAKYAGWEIHKGYACYRLLCIDSLFFLQHSMTHWEGEKNERHPTPRTTTFWPYCCCLPCQARESHPLSVTPAVLQQFPLPLYFIRALNALVYFGSDPMFYCNSPLHLRIDRSKTWSQKRGSACLKSPRMLYHSCWEQSRYKGALTSKTNTHNISTSTHEETGKTQYSTAMV